MDDGYSGTSWGRPSFLEMMKHMEDLDKIIRHIYEDNVLGKLTDARYLKLSQEYEKEQAEIFSGGLYRMRTYGNDFHMKKKTWMIGLSVIVGLLGTFLIGAGRAGYESEVQRGIAQEVLRFHVRANSDSKEDQRVKMEVKEEVVAYLQPILEDAADAKESRKLVRHHMAKVEEIAEKVLAREGCAYGVSLKLGQSHFPKKTYGDCTFPAGTYEALIVRLGAGAGHNWWCMLYPGLCFVDESHAVVEEAEKEKLKENLTDGEYRYVIRFKWLG